MSFYIVFTKMKLFANAVGFFHAGIVFICDNGMKISSEVVEFGVNLMYSSNGKTLFD